jgi:hypothetical protein
LEKSHVLLRLRCSLHAEVAAVTTRLPRKIQQLPNRLRQQVLLHLQPLRLLRLTTPILSMAPSSPR